MTHRTASAPSKDRKKLTPQQRGQLGGLATAHKLGSEGMATIGRRGGDALIERYGKGHMRRLSLRSHGYDVAITTEAKP